MRKDGLIELVHRFHDMVREEKNPTIKSYYWKHYNHLFRLWFKTINFILERK